jgi:hypothetical protein
MPMIREPATKKVPRTARQDPFTGEEWSLLRLAPALVSGGVGATDPSGLFTSIEQATAGVQGTARAYRRNGRRLRLFNALAADCSAPGVPDAKTLLGEGSCEQQMHHYKAAVLERVQAAVGLVARKGSRAEAQAYRQMILAMAEKVANGSNERAFVADVQRAAGVLLNRSRACRSASGACRHES